VTTTPLSPRFKVLGPLRPRALVLVPLALACAGCAGQHRAPLHLAPAITAPAAPWWASANDPLLKDLVEAGLHHDAALLCRGDALALRAHKAGDRKLRARLIRLVAAQDTPGALSADRYALARARDTLALRIALAYVEARRWQERITLRDAALAPLRDNADIARFRREAGLVSALDGDMADVMTGLDSSSVEAARDHFAQAIAQLAQLTGTLPDDLRVRLGPEGHLPELEPGPDTTAPDTTAPDTTSPDAAARDLAHRPDLMALQLRLGAHLARLKWTQERLDAQLADPEHSALPDMVQWNAARTRAQADIRQARDGLETALSRLAPIAQSLALAQRAQGDARLAYRSGTDSFATLYVAEGAALAAQERQIDARAAIAGATLALWHAQGLGWTQADLTPIASGNVCDQP
jgi:outer membrane protein TolC